MISSPTLVPDSFRAAAIRLALGGLLLFPAAVPTARATMVRFSIDPEAGESEVTFTSRAPLESFSGSTRRIRGFIEFDPEARLDSIGVRIEVELATLDTGIALRNRHMRRNHLETDRFPLAVFEGARLRPIDPIADQAFELTRLEPGEPISFVAAGVLELHGIRRRMEIPVHWSFDRDDRGQRIAIQAEFKVRLSDHQIARPGFLVMKLDGTQQIAFQAVARPAERKGHP